MIYNVGAKHRPTKEEYTKEIKDWLKGQFSESNGIKTHA